ncbi:hypothetical protein Cgig2_028721 [Carnegiea gigantea]|uniref:Acyl-[acyl-carrier-protein] hydrolase n=1 Tax=Carnegiea gigantea TaxID=171969 RepID=A0A9Q1QFU6_9CARY|nr:hypothetical protein Cgig2_028721 [Carnegiea gigantea]
MPTISNVLSIPPWMPPSKLPRENKNFGVIFHSKVRTPTMQVKLDDVQDPFKLNNSGKIADHEFATSRYVCDEYVVRQNFLVRLYELDIHHKASLEALLNYTEETSVNLCKSSGLAVGGFGVPKEMSSRNLIWVIGRMQVVVNSYPSWGDIVHVETWCSALGKHTLTCSSRLTDPKTGKKLMRVDSDFLMINEKTRRLSRIPEEIKARGEPYVRNLDPLPIANKFENCRKLQKIDEDEAVHVQNGIRGTPESVRENCEPEAIILEYRRECGRENVLKSLSVASSGTPQEFHHLLVLENGTEVARARTLWRSKSIK